MSEGDLRGDDGERGPGAPLRVLVMCTANQCRSPMAEVIAADLLSSRGVDAEVVSCGTMDGGAPATPGAVKAVARRGLDLRAHRSHRIDADTVGAADLILTMERAHLASVAELSVEAVARSFTLVELADLAVVVGPRRAGVTVEGWIASANAMRHPSAVLSVSTADDVEDPMGGPARLYRRTAELIAEMLGSVVDALYPPEATSPA